MSYERLYILRTMDRLGKEAEHWVRAYECKRVAGFLEFRGAKEYTSYPIESVISLRIERD